MMFAVVRIEPNGYSFRGPVGRRLTLAEAKAEAIKLQRDYPNQEFGIVGVVSTASMSKRVNLKTSAPSLGEKKRKAPVIQLVKKEAEK